MSRRWAARTVSVLILGGSLSVSCIDAVVIGEWLGPQSGAGAGGEEGGGTGSGGQSSLGGEGGSAPTPPEPRPVFQSPILVAELSDPDAKDQDPTLTEDLLEIYFFSDRTGNAEIWTSRRTDREAPWDAPSQVMELAAPELDINPAVSRDGLRLWFHSQRTPVGIWLTERPTRDDPWGPPVQIDVFGGEIAPGPSADELRMGISVIREGESQRDIFESTRSSTSEAWSTPVDLLGINTMTDDSTPFLIGDGREILFSSARTGYGDLYFARRVTLADPVEEPLALTELNEPESLESHPHLSADGTRIYFGSARSGNTDIYEAERVQP